MASRRQKFKPLAGIQKARRAQNVISESNAAKLNEAELPEVISIKVEDAKKEKTPEVSESVSNDVQSISCDDSQKPEAKPEETPSIPTAPRPLRRSIKPAVVIPDRKRKTVQPSEVKAEENCDKQTLTETVDKSPRKAVGAITPLTPLTLKQENSDNIQKPPSCDDTFKPPFLSPSIQSAHAKRPEFVYNPLDQQSGEGSDDPTKSPVHSAKVRQRIRPTPYFARRNSVQGSNIESDDESNKRQRHLSTSSNHSNHNFNNNVSQKSLPSENTRIRTESVCSNISDATFQTFPKPKRIARSEEFQRIANAKKEFNQRFNGKTPDKQHLTMYDLIYYNPNTNPLKNPAVKSSDIKDRRLSSASSVHSVASIRSIKTETKTPDDSVETEMPVPQLKLGPNGEIVLDEKSLVIETTGDKEARETLANADIIYDDEFSGSSGFYRRQKRTREWDANETIKFYRCLHSVGTDFSLMLMLFPNRNRRDLKLKFKKEEKTNLHLINKALLHPKEFNIDDLKVELEKEEKELERKKKEWEELKQKHTRERREQVKLLKQKNRKNSVAREMTGGDTIYEHEFATASRKNRKKGAFVPHSNTVNNDSLPSFEYSFSQPASAVVATTSNVKHEYILPTDAPVTKKPPLTSDDILNMDIVFDDVIQSEEASASLNQSFIESEVTSKKTVSSPTVVSNNNPGDNSMHVDTTDQHNVDTQRYGISKSSIKVEYIDENGDIEDEEEIETEIPERDACHSDSESRDSLSTKELAVVASHSVDDPNNVIYEVYAVSPITGELSDKPLDLPPDVVEQIRKSMDV